MQLARTIIGRMRGRGDVTYVLDCVAEAFQCAGQPGSAIGVRAHEATGATLAAVDGCANENTMTRRHPRSP